MSEYTTLKHTPGVWGAVQTPYGCVDEDKWFVGSTDVHVCDVIEHADPSESEANACLIAAAPDLLAALEALTVTISVDNVVAGLAAIQKATITERGA